MISKLEQIKTGNKVPLEENISLFTKDGKVFHGAEEIPLKSLNRFKDAVRVMIVEGQDPELLKTVREEIRPELIIVESRS